MNDDPGAAWSTCQRLILESKGSSQSSLISTLASAWPEYRERGYFRRLCNARNKVASCWRAFEEVTVAGAHLQACTSS